MAGVVDPGYSCHRKSTMKINIILSVLIILVVSPMAQAVSPAPDGGYPGATRRKGNKHSSTSPPVRSIRPLVGFRSKATPLAISTRLSGPERSLPRLRTKIRLSALGRSSATRPARPTRLMERLLCLTIRTAATTRPMARKHFLLTELARTTRRLVRRRSFSMMVTPITRKHLTTRPLEAPRFSATPRAKPTVHSARGHWSQTKPAVSIRPSVLRRF